MNLIGVVLVTGLVAGMSVVRPSLAAEPGCPDSSNPSPAVIFCDDFEASAPVPESRGGPYIEYIDAGGKFIRVSGAGFNDSYGMQATWNPGDVSVGQMLVRFGRHPGNAAPLRANEDFRELYWREYIRTDEGWQGDPGKQSRVYILASGDTAWGPQAMIAHLWSNSVGILTLDPVSGTSSSGTVITTRYNDFENFRWLGGSNAIDSGWSGRKTGVTPLYSTGRSGIWHCVESHVRLNDPGLSNGLNEFWIDGQLDARLEGINFVGSYQEYGINVASFENYWNSGSTQLNVRTRDNLVVSTQRIGCLEGETVDQLGTASNDSSAPTVGSSPAEENPTIAEESTTTADEGVTTAEESTTTAEESTTTAAESSTTTEESTTTRGNKLKGIKNFIKVLLASLASRIDAKESTRTADQGVTTAEESTTTAEESTTTAAESTTTAEESTTTAAESTTTADSGTGGEDSGSSVQEGTTTADAGSTPSDSTNASSDSGGSTPDSGAPTESPGGTSPGSGLPLGTVRLAWDGSSSSNVGGYKIYYGVSSTNYAYSLDVGDQLTFALSGLEPGKVYYFGVTAYDSSRAQESGFSNQVEALVEGG